MTHYFTRVIVNEVDFKGLCLWNYLKNSLELINYRNYDSTLLVYALVYSHKVSHFIILIFSAIVTLNYSSSSQLYYSILNLIKKLFAKIFVLSKTSQNVLSLCLHKPKTCNAAFHFVAKEFSVEKQTVILSCWRARRTCLGFRKQSRHETSIVVVCTYRLGYWEEFHEGLELRNVHLFADTRRRATASRSMLLRAKPYRFGIVFVNVKYLCKFQTEPALEAIAREAVVS